MTSNESKRHQTEGRSQLLSNEMTELLGFNGEGPEIEKVLDGSFIMPPSVSLATTEFLKDTAGRHNCQMKRI